MAKHLEKKGDVAGAIQNFERSETHRFEVPRLLFEDWSMLETYIQKSTDKELKRWWAQYMESTGEMELALQYYEVSQALFLCNISHQAPAVFGFSAFPWGATSTGGSHGPQISRI